MEKITQSDCTASVIPIRDCLDIISGKWKLPILGALLDGKKRFKELERSIPAITPKMLSKELRELEINQLVKRTVYDTVPVMVEYELAPYGRSLDKVLFEMKEWGAQHRKRIMTSDNPVRKELESVES
ncbi:winged helix-turn-helix transcriptional regulator [Runella sp.]|uniref:winged helix-turn-helix transcriptional regulator n=1 Tax=Runella sp. TaxID=1960881 RepID=UPI003D099482